MSDEEEITVRGQIYNAVVTTWANEAHAMVDQLQQFAEKNIDHMTIDEKLMLTRIAAQCSFGRDRNPRLVAVKKDILQKWGSPSMTSAIWRGSGWIEWLALR